MNSLEHYLTTEGIDPVKAMNLLQEHGAVSDLCVNPADVGNSVMAVAWLHQNAPHLRQDASRGRFDGGKERRRG
jgi:hypothetical protein